MIEKMSIISDIIEVVVQGAIRGVHGEVLLADATHPLMYTDPNTGLEITYTVQQG